MRTAAALLAFAVTLVATWVAVALAWAAISRLFGIDDPKGGIAFGVVLLIAPFIAFGFAAACGLYVIRPRDTPASQQ